MKTLFFRQLLVCLIIFICPFVAHADSMSSEASIQSPGADMANFPNSAFTLPQGRAYLEVAPVTYNSRSRNDAPAQFSAGYFLRYGLLDTVELRLLSEGYTWVNDETKTTGMSPQVFDVKWHLWDEQREAYFPAMGIEVSVKSQWAGQAFKKGWLPALSLNFDQSLPFEIMLEYNLGFVSQKNDAGKIEYQFALSWALQREIVTDVALFVNGYTNTGNALTTTAIGAGFQWTPFERLAIFGNMSAGLSATTPKMSALFGFAVAF